MDLHLDHRLYGYPYILSILCFFRSLALYNCNIFEARSSSSKPPALQTGNKSQRDLPSRLSSVAEVPSSPTSGHPPANTGQLPANLSGDHLTDHLTTCTPRDHPSLARTASTDTVASTHMSHTNESSGAHAHTSSGRKFRKISNSIIATQRLNSNSSFGNFAKRDFNFASSNFLRNFQKI